MNVLHLSTYDSGGAGRAVSRLHQGLRSSGVNSQVMVQTKDGDDPQVIAYDPLLPASNFMQRVHLFGEFLPTKLYPDRKRISFSSQWLPERVASQVARLNPDVVHLHWIGHGFVQIETLAKLGRPLVWTLHDMWPFTGGCHYSEACEAYELGCGQCPILGSHRQRDLASWIWHRKQKAWQDIDISVVAPSHWLADCARKSALLKDAHIEVIPHGIDLEVYAPTDKQQAKAELGLPLDKKLILFGALNATKDKRKGFDLLLSALRTHRELDRNKEAIHLVVFGAQAPENPVDMGYKTHYLGHVKTERALSLVYSAAEVMVVPSVQEAFGQTAFEALACGTPVVAFDATGLKDIVMHQETGYLAEPFRTDDLARGIRWVLADEQRHHQLCLRSREVAQQEFSLALQASRYKTRYETLYEKARREKTLDEKTSPGKTQVEVLNK